MRQVLLRMSLSGCQALRALARESRALLPELLHKPSTFEPAIQVLLAGIRTYSAFKLALLQTWDSYLLALQTSTIQARQHLPMDPEALESD